VSEDHLKTRLTCTSTNLYFDIVHCWRVPSYQPFLYRHSVSYPLVFWKCH